MSSPYPFAALVGSEDLTTALLLGAVHPGIGGVLVRGEKGTAKSTAARGLAALLPPVAVAAGCRFACDPAAPNPACPDAPCDARPAHTRPVALVELPVGASEDRVTGSLDLERALTQGTRAFEPGLLAAAHRGILYVDEVNLLGDHLVDVLLDAAAMGEAIVEREGVGVRHPARFQLVGTMNPEEGELRPQLLDRFGLTVGVHASRDPAERAEVVRRRLAYEADPAAFAARWAAADAALAQRVVGARALLPRVRLGERMLAAVVAACTAFEVDGLRADLVTAKAASALAAWHGRDARHAGRRPPRRPPRAPAPPPPWPVRGTGHRRVRPGRRPRALRRRPRTTTPSPSPRPTTSRTATSGTGRTTRDRTTTRDPATTLDRTRAPSTASPPARRSRARRPPDH